MRLFKGWLAAVILSTAVFGWLQPATAYDTNDVLNCYGLGEEVFTVDPTPFEQEIEARTSEIEVANEQLTDIANQVDSLQDIVLYNKVLEERISIDYTDAIRAAEAKVRATSLKISNAIDAPIADIVALEATYERQVRELNDLLYQQENSDVAPVGWVDEALAELAASKRDTEETITVAETAIAAAQYELDNLPPAKTFIELGDGDYYPVIGYEYRVNSNYGTRWDPITQANYSFHEGLDLYAPSGTSIGAWFNGTVESTGYSSSSGNYVWLNHGDGIRTFYCHLSAIKCARGQTVKQGDVIALSGNTGSRTTGAHLHLGLYINGASRDPRKVLDS